MDDFFAGEVASIGEGRLNVRDGTVLLDPSITFLSDDGPSFFFYKGSNAAAMLQ